MTLLPDSPWPAASLEQVEAAVGAPVSVVGLKELDRLEPGTTELLQRSPFAGIGYLDEQGAPVSTFVGGPEGFATVEDPRQVSLRLPDDAPPPRQGSGVGLVFLFPGVGEVLRVNGAVTATEHPRVRLRVEEVYVHCARAISRAALWDLPTARVRDLATPARAADPSGPLDDPEVAKVMANSPFLVLTSFAADGSADTSPRGDAPGFVHRLDADTLAIPDRKGNRRADTFHNLVDDPRISLAALVPGTSEVALVHGVGAMTTDPAVLAPMALNGVPPHAALLVRVHGAHVRQVQPIADAALWSDTSREVTARVPDLNALASRHIAQNSGAGAGAVMSFLVRLLETRPGLMTSVTRLGIGRALAREGYPPAGNDSRRRQARIVSLRRESADIVSVRLRALDRGGFTFLPGQFFTVATRVEGRMLRRAYSASDLPGKVLRLSIKRDDGGVVSTHFHRDARRGDVVELTGPSGEFTPLAAGGTHDLVLIGVGSGITPLHCTVRAALHAEGGRRVILLYGCRTEDIAFRRSLDRLAAKHPDRLVVRYLLSRPTPGWTGGVGRIGPQTLPALLDGAAVGDDATYWVCGPEGLMAGVREVLAGRGIPDSRIHEERFARGVPADHVEGPPETMTVTRNGTPLGELTVPGDSTILEAGLEAGLPMKYSCTVGECGECAVRLLSGKVAMSTPHCLSPDDLADGVVLTCVGRPTERSSIDVDHTLRHARSVGSGFASWQGQE